MDAVHKPAHYSGEGIECIDVIEAALGPYGFRMFCLGNVLKYSWRHKLKGGAEDLAKADVYRAWHMAGTAANRPKHDPDRPLTIEEMVQRESAKWRDANEQYRREISPVIAELIERGDEEAPTSHLKAGEATQ